jgi:hypothetical protein
MGYARVPNGTGNFQIQEPTYNTTNGNNLSVKEIEGTTNYSFYPNPVQADLIIESTGNVIQTIKINSLLGQELFNKKDYNATTTTVDFSNFSKGIYFITINDSKIIKVMKK